MQLRSMLILSTVASAMTLWNGFGVCFAFEGVPDQAGVEYFEQHIRPVLAQKCYECHSSKSEILSGGLRLDSPEMMRKGGDNGPAVVPGNVKNSLLLDALRQETFEMPPDGKLPDETIARFETWIKMGAPDPRTEDASDVTESQQKPSRDFWSFRPPQPVAVPEVRDESWPRADVDRFILARLEENDLTPVADAGRERLIRRAYFDLWGLPPAPEAVAEFVNDQSADAFPKLVDRLLESPRFGERWGRHWLDVARYAESTGHERNFLYPHAWRYRDYVIESFNKDKPYDRFIKEQIAGDKLPAESLEQRDEQLVATGFLALGPRNLLNGRDEDYRLDTADDQINVTMRAMMGLTVSCARCHDHKFEPISTKEYYALAGIFLSTETLYGTVPGTGGGNNSQPRELVPLGPNAQEQHERVLEYNKKIEEATKQFAKAKSHRKKLLSLPEKTLAKKQDELDEAEKKYRKAQQQLEETKANAPQPPPYAMGVRDAKKIVDTEVRIAGSYRNKGVLAPRGVLECVTTGPLPEIPADASGRLALAEWLTSPDNPLTARVMVNRIWRHLFGRGIVPTADNFGHNGQPPSHPELLDWLALRFRDDGWSVKSMIRRLMLSRTYQLAAVHDSHNYETDPDNVLLWRRTPRRLEAEALRDAMLAVGGRLQFAPPESGSVVARLGDGCLVRQIDPEKLVLQEPCRSIYLPAARFFEPEMQQVFDGASPSLVVGDRDVTNVPTQSLFLLNNEFVIEQSKQTARRLLARDDLDDASRVELAYRLAFSRPPNKDELRRSLAFLGHEQAVSVQENQNEQQARQRELRWAGFCQALFTAAEFRYVY